MPHPTPTKEGHYWAKLLTPQEMPVTEDWVSVDYEVVQVFDNNRDGENRFGAFVPGIEPSQPLNAFKWGPRIPDYKPSEEERSMEEYQKRVITERDELQEKIAKLETFREGQVYDGLDYTDRKFLRIQLILMMAYCEVLNSRIGRFT